MSFQYAGLVDKGASTRANVERHRKDLLIDPQVSLLAERNRKDYLAGRAGQAALRRLHQETGIGSTIDEEGNIEYDFDQEALYKKLRGAAKDLSQAPKNQIAMRSSMGDAAQNVYATQSPEGNLTTIETGSPEAVVQEQERLAQAARRFSSSLLPQALSMADLKTEATQPPAATAAPKPQPQPQAQPPQAASGASVMQNAAPIKPVSVRTGENVSIQQSGSASDQFSGSAQPLQTQVQYSQGGYKDPEPDFAIQRLKARMAGIQGDVLRGMGVQQSTSEEVDAAREMEQTEKRYGMYNQQTQAPQLQGKQDGGAISQSSGQNTSFNNQFNKGKSETSADRQAAEENAEREYRTQSGAIWRVKNGVTTTGGYARFGEIGEDFERDVVSGKIKGAQITKDENGRDIIYVPPGTNVRRIEANLQGNVGNKALYGSEDTTPQAAGYRAQLQNALNTNVANARVAGYPDPSMLYPTKQHPDTMQHRVNRLKERLQPPRRK